MRWKFPIAFALLVAASSGATAKSDLAAGNYVLYFAPDAFAQRPVLLIKVESKDGKEVASIIDGPKAWPSGPLATFKVDGKNVTFALEVFGTQITFEGKISAQDPKVVLGTLGNDEQVLRVRLVATEEDKLESPGAVQNLPDVPAPLKKVREFYQSMLQTRTQLQKTKDEEERNKLKTKLEELDKEADEKLPGLFKEVLEKHADNAGVVDAATTLLGKAEKYAKPEEVAGWMKTALAFAEAYGPRYRMELLLRCITALESKKGFEDVTLDLAEKLAKEMPDSTPLQKQYQVVKLLKGAQEKAGKSELAGKTEARLAMLDAALDKQFEEKVPPFKPKAYAGRKAKSDRVVVCELFTGAQCPPCVGADAAFDALQKAYRPSDLVLLQYHMHIPGPDPLTNPDGEARWKYYGDLVGTPAALISGKSVGRGGGGLPQSEGKFKEFQQAIDPLLEETTPIKLSGAASAKGDKISIKVEVGGIKEGDEKLKLRLVLVEETVKFVGGNGMRFHHHVVRAFPGGVEGLALKEKTESKSAEVDLSELRKSLTKYLAGVGKGAAFWGAEPPLALKHLRVVAFVQDDSSKEILQALEMEVPESK